LSRGSAAVHDRRGGADVVSRNLGSGGVPVSNEISEDIFI
jgi:hypothetical protein